MYCKNAAVSWLQVWVFTLVWTSPLLMMSHTESAYHRIQKQQVQICRTPSGELWQKLYFLSNMILFFALPLLAIMFFFSFIVHALHNSQKVEKLLSGFRASKVAQNHRKQVIIMLFSVIVMFFICVLPFRLLSMWLIFASPNTIQSLDLEVLLNLLHFARAMFFLNSAGNPILYNVFSSRFRRAFVSLCTRKRSRGGVTRSSTMSHKAVA